MTEPPPATFWAREEAARLRRLSATARYEDWAPHFRSTASAALEFLRRQAPGTDFYVSAADAFGKDKGMQAGQAFEQTARALEAWAQFVEAGFVTHVPYAARARADAATDLMEQVQTLLDDPKVHPAAPVMLAGAALEELLRSLVTAQSLEVKGKPGLSTYASALRATDALSVQDVKDVKDVTAWAGQRNAAAHGEFEQLSRSRAQLMVDGVNLFMRQRSPLSESGNGNVGRT